MKKNNKVLIFDTTLRDGEQSPGAVLKPDEKLKIAKALELLGVDIIEAGFPISSKGDFHAVETISQTLNKPIICALARTVEKDINTAWQAIKKAKKKRIHTFIGTSDIHISNQLNSSRSKVLETIYRSVKQAKSYTKDVEFSPMDATRSDILFLCKSLELAINAGATTLNIPDTVGYALPWEIERLIFTIKKEVKGINKVILSIHCHNDLGLATANSLIAIKAGVRQVECTINGIGERAGNTALEEISMIIKSRSQELILNTNINSENIYIISRLVSKLTRMHTQPNKAIVGRNAFAHASGIHQDGYLKNRITYEIMNPKDIGLKKSRIILGARSGRHALKYRLSLLGYNPNDSDLNQTYQSFLILAERKKIVTNKDLLTIFKKK